MDRGQRTSVPVQRRGNELSAIFSPRCSNDARESAERASSGAWARTSRRSHSVHWLAWVKSCQAARMDPEIDIDRTNEEEYTVERIIQFDLNADEKAMFEKSVAAVNGLLAACKKLEPSLA